MNIDKILKRKGTTNKVLGRCLGKDIYGRNKIGTPFYDYDNAGRRHRGEIIEENDNDVVVQFKRGKKRVSKSDFSTSQGGVLQ